jgi:hypothetical protein
VDAGGAFIFIIQKKDTREFTKTIAKPVAGPVPVSPVIDEFQYVGRLINKKPKALSRSSACADGARPKPPAVVCLQIYKFIAQDPLCENRNSLEIFELTDVGWL